MQPRERLSSNSFHDTLADFERTLLVVLLHELHKRFLMYKASILPILEDAQVAET